jgi:hypothetical protein
MLTRHVSILAEALRGDRALTREALRESVADGVFHECDTACGDRDRVRVTPFVSTIAAVT